MPSGGVNTMFKDHTKQVVLIYDGVDAHLEDNVLNTIQTGCFEGFEFADCLAYVLAGEVAIWFKRLWVGS